MPAVNVVRVRVKPGREQDFINAGKAMSTTMKGFRKGSMIKTGDRSYCFIGEWDRFDSIVAARPGMIASLDTMRPMLEDLGQGLGVSDPVSGETVVEIGGR